MIKAYAATKPGGELEPFEYDPGELKSDEVEIKILEVSSEDKKISRFYLFNCISPLARSHCSIF